MVTWPIITKMSNYNQTWTKTTIVKFNWLGNWGMARWRNIMTIIRPWTSGRCSKWIVTATTVMMTLSSTRTYRRRRSLKTRTWRFSEFSLSCLITKRMDLLRWEICTQYCKGTAAKTAIPFGIFWEICTSNRKLMAVGRRGITWASSKIIIDHKRQISRPSPKAPWTLWPWVPCRSLERRATTSRVKASLIPGLWILRWRIKKCLRVNTQRSIRWTTSPCRPKYPSESLWRSCGQSKRTWRRSKRFSWVHPQMSRRLPLIRDCQNTVTRSRWACKPLITLFNKEPTKTPILATIYHHLIRECIWRSLSRRLVTKWSQESDPRLD